MLYKKTPFRYAEVVQAQRKLTRKGVFMGTRAQSLAHTKWLCKYHIVFAPKYRRKIIFSQLRESIREILRDLCKYKGVDILEGHLMPDHVHLLVSIPPKISVSSFMGLRTSDILQSEVAHSFFDALLINPILELAPYTSQEDIDAAVVVIVNRLNIQYGIDASLYSDIAFIIMNVLSDCMGYDSSESVTQRFF